MELECRRGEDCKSNARRVAPDYLCKRISEDTARATGERDDREEERPSMRSGNERVNNFETRRYSSRAADVYYVLVKEPEQGLMQIYIHTYTLTKSEDEIGTPLDLVHLDASIYANQSGRYRSDSA